MSRAVVTRQSSRGPHRSAILIFGASVRAAAQSAARSGMQSTCADLFADVDLCESADVLPVEHYPDDFPQIAKLVAPCPWMYTGGLENHPRIVRAVSSVRPLWGNDAAVLGHVRDPLGVRDVLGSAGLPAADVRSAGNPPPPNEEWLLKPIGGAGGNGICVWNDAAAESPTLGRPHYFQQKMSGFSVSAVFLGTGTSAHLIGVTRQFVGTRTLHSSPFSYAGSLGPIELPAPLWSHINETGRVLSDAFRLRGLFGIDSVLDGESARLTEINPRYTASVENLEYAHGLPLLGWHGRACETFTDSAGSAEVDRNLHAALPAASNPARRCVGKAILYAPRDVVTPPLDVLRTEGIDSLPSLADVPRPGTLITRGRPICTILAAGGSERRCLRSLASRVRRAQRHIFSRVRCD